MTNLTNLKKYNAVKLKAKMFFEEKETHGLLDTTVDSAVKDLMQFLVSADLIDKRYERMGKPNNVYNLFKMGA